MSRRPRRRCIEHPCPRPVVDRGRCEDHRHPAWEGAAPAEGRPTGRAWRRLRAEILARDSHICYICKQPGADQVDHIRSIKEGGAKWAPGNLGAVHEDPCHKAKTQAEAKRGKKRAKERREAAAAASASPKRSRNGNGN